MHFLPMKEEKKKYVIIKILFFCIAYYLFQQLNNYNKFKKKKLNFLVELFNNDELK